MPDPVETLQTTGDLSLAPRPSLDSIVNPATHRRLRRLRRVGVALAVIVALGGATTAVLRPDGRRVQTQVSAGVGIAIGDIPEGVTARIVDGVSLFLVRHGEEVRAFLPRTTHLDGETLWWCPSEQLFISPSHGETYEGSGDEIAGPGARGLDSVAVTVTDGTVRIDPNTITPGRERAAGGDASGAPKVPTTDWATAGFCRNPLEAPTGSRSPVSTVVMKGPFLESPKLEVAISPSSGAPGTTVQITATGCDDPTGQNHAISFNNNASNVTARSDSNTVRFVPSAQDGSTLTATYTISTDDRTGGAGLFFVQCAATRKTASFEVTPQP
jgi:nitrite reductase/ring-hydroxylating ferredoxin subunit